ncbi:MAG: DegT/DnrJ/EryC1/StrS family aminotransferase, partial [Acidobacteria bacterium]|nr:DegT/DnrJ/EryC1/StrS family aminotransferase [Acidobacteriota bacterium]
IEERVDARRRNFELYREALDSEPGISFMPEPKECRSTRWLTALLIDPEEFGATREEIRQHLEEKNIEARPLWKPLHLQPVFRDHRAVGGGVSESLFELGLCLPSGSSLSTADLERVVAAIQSVPRRSSVSTSGSRGRSATV